MPRTARAQGARRRGQSLVVVGGLLFSQFLTLFVTPVFYTYMESFQAKVSARLRARRQRRQETISPVPPIS